jgi:hypothetical protein
LGLALCAGLFVATRGSQDPGGAVTAAPTPVKAPAAKKHAVVTKDAQPATRHEAAPAGSKHHSQAPATHAQRNAGKPQAKAPVATDPAAQKAAVVNKALDRGDVVVFFFTRPGPADDTATRQAVNALHGLRHVTVVRAGLEDLTAYRPVLQGAGVSQVPAVVVVKKDAKARLIEGFVDGGTLRQNVADALR